MRVLLTIRLNKPKKKDEDLCMKNLIKTMKNKVRSAAVAVKVTVECKRAEGYVDTGVKILVAVVLGALLLAGLYTLFNNNILPTLTYKITALFNYTGK